MRLGDLDALKKSILARLDDDEARISEIVEEEIDNAPTIEPFERIGAICNENCGGYRPKGEWLGNLFCSKCGISKFNYFTVIRGENGDRSRPFGIWKYCPNCGADMRGAK